LLAVPALLFHAVELREDVRSTIGRHPASVPVSP
jgi:hypothetical protein